MRRLLLHIVCATWMIGLLAGIVGCGGAARDSSGVSTTASAQTSSTNQSDTREDMMQGCTADQIQNLVEGFIQSFNDGDIATLDGLFAVGESFRWYSTHPPGAPRDHEDRTQLMTYFEARHNAGERLALQELTFGGNSDGVGNFEYRLMRRADDIPETRYEGKGAADCTTNDEAVIIVWAMAPA